MARGKWPFLNQQSTTQATQDTSKPLPIPNLTSADAKKFGFENFGNTCYANSVLQALYFCAPFRDLLLQSVDPPVALAPPSPALAPAPSPPPPLVPVRRKPERKQSTSGITVDAAPLPLPPVAPIPTDPPTLLAALRSLFYYISSHPAARGTVGPRAFIDKLKEVNTAFDSTMHQDAHEFLNYLLNKIVEDIREEIKEANDDLSNSLTTTSTNSGHPPQDATFVHRLFEGVLTSETRCLTCETVSSRDESFLDLSIDIEQNSSVTACLRQFSASEMLCQKNKFFCDACCDLQEAEKRMKIKKLPNVLALHLKRFKYQEDVQRYIKLVYRVAFPFELRLFNTVDGIDDADRLYNLFGIVVHIGNGPHHGHYVSIIKTLGSWLIFDDKSVKDISELEITEYFGDSSSGSAYVLYYQAVDIDLPGLGLAQEMAREMREKGMHMDVSAIDVTTQQVLERKMIEEEMALPSGLLVDEKGLNGSSSSLGEPLTPSASSVSASDPGPVTSPLRASASTGMSGVSAPLAMAVSRSLPSPPTALNGSVPSPAPSTSTSPSVAGKMDSLISTLRRKPSMSIKTGLNAVGLGLGTPNEGRKQGVYSSIEGRRPSTAEARRSLGGERSPALVDAYTTRPATASGVRTPLPPIPSHSTKSGPGAQTVPPTPKLPFSEGPASTQSASSTPLLALHRPSGDSEDGVGSVSDKAERNEKDYGSAEKGASREKKEKGVKKAANWVKRKSFKIGERVGRTASENSETLPPLSPRTRGGEDAHGHPNAGPSSASQTRFRTSMQRPRRPAENDGSDAHSHPPSSRDLGSAHSGPAPSAPPLALPTPHASKAPTQVLQSPSPHDHHLQHRTKPAWPNGDVHDTNYSPLLSPISLHSTHENGHSSPVPRIQSSLSTPSSVTTTTLTNTHSFPDSIDHPPVRQSSLKARPLPQPEGSPGRKKSTPAFPTFRDDMGERAEERVRDSVIGRSTPVRSTSIYGEGKEERPLPPVPTLAHEHRTRATKGGGAQNGFGFGHGAGGSRGTTHLGVDGENEYGAPEDPQSSFSPAPSSSHTPPSSYAPSLSAPSSHNQTTSTFGLGSFGNADNSTASSTASGQKRATRKLSLLGWRKDKDKEEEKEREKGRQKERDKAGPSSFTRF